MTIAEYPPELPPTDDRPGDAGGAEGQAAGDEEQHQQAHVDGAHGDAEERQEGEQRGEHVADEGDHGSALPQTGADAAPTLSDIYDDLDRFMIGDPIGEDDGPGLQDQHVANAILRRLGRRERELAMVEDIYRAELERLEAWAEGRRHDIGQAMAKDADWLTNWHRAQLGEHRTGPLTINLPAGRLRATANRPQVEIDDEAAFLAWAEENAPELLRKPEPKPPVTSPDRAALGKLVTALKIPKTTRPGETFTVVPGVIAVARGDRFTAEPDQDLDPT